jgi:hypothetical protein
MVLVLLTLAVVVGIFTIAKYVEAVRKSRLPAGIQHLPGPKGMYRTTVVVDDNVEQS